MSKVVLITGGTRGIGKQTAKLFLEKGYQVAVCGIQEKNIQEVKSEFESSNFVAFKTDVSNAGAVRKLFFDINNKYNKIDVLVNNAGVLWHGDFKDQSPTSINQLVDINVKGLMYTTSEALAQMISAKDGIIINVSSGAGKTAYPGIAVYSATKFAVIGFTQALAKEVEESGVKVYAICPGMVATDMIVEYTGKKMGMPPQKIAKKIISLAGENPPINPGECLEVYR